MIIRDLIAERTAEQ